MSEQRTSGRRRAVPAGLLGMIALVVATEAYLGGRDADLTTIWAADWRQAGRAARDEATGAEILCFGDSLAKFGLLPGVIEERTGRPAHNLALSVGQVSASYVLLRRAIDAGAAPRAVVIDMIPHLLAQGPEYNIRHWPELAGPAEALEVAAASRSPAFFTRAMASRWLDSVRCRFEIREAVRAALRGEGRSYWPAVAFHLRNWRVNGGAQPMAPNGAFEGDGELWPAELYPPSWRAHPGNVALLRRFLGLAEAEGIAVFWVIMPFSPEVQSRRESLGLDASYSRFVRRMQDEFPGLVVLDARHSGYGPGLHIDPIHLDRRGAAALSAEVGDAIRDALDGGRRPGGPTWLAVRDYEDRPTGAMIEDLEESRLAVGTALGRRR